MSDYKHKCTNELLNTTHAHQSSGRFPPSKIVDNCGLQIISCVARDQLELACFSVSSSQGTRHNTTSTSWPHHFRRYHLFLPTSKFISHSVTFLLSSPYAHGVQLREDIILLTCWLFLLCWLHLNCCGHRLNIIETSWNKLMVVPRRWHCRKLGRMQKTLCVQGTAFRIVCSCAI